MLIDAGEHEGVPKDEISKQIDNGNIFKYLEDNFQPSISLGLENLSEEDKYHLLGEWQSMANATISEADLGVSKNGICLLLAYVIEGFQMRTFSGKVWPGPEPL
jgi:hypothetical protein